MKLPITCGECDAELVEQGTPYAPKAAYGVHVRDDGVYELTCHKGHKTTTVLQNQKYEVLFDSACLAFLDGYFREAVSNFAVAQERFFEFFVRVACRHLKIDRAQVDAAFKELTTRSERELGAFHVAHLVLTGTAFDSKGQDPKFRNRVVHRGYFPTTEEAFAFGEMMYASLTRSLDELVRTAREAFIDEERDYVSAAHRKADAAGVKTSMIVKTSLSGAVSKTEWPSFQKTLEDMAAFHIFVTGNG